MALRLVTSIIIPRAGKGDPDCSKNKTHRPTTPSGIFSKIPSSRRANHGHSQHSHSEPGLPMVNLSQSRVKNFHNLISITRAMSANTLVQKIKFTLKQPCEKNLYISHFLDFSLRLSFVILLILCYVSIFTLINSDMYCFFSTPLLQSVIKFD